MKRFLVTGGAGFIGSAVARMLVRDTPHEVMVVDKLTYAGNLDSLKPVANSPRYRFEQADIVDADRMRSVIESFRPDVVMHLAAESHVDRSIDGPGAFVQTNVVGTFALLQASLAYWRSLSSAGQEAFRFHHISTDEVFGSLGEDGFFHEEYPYQPTSPYSASKAASDHFVRAWNHTYGLPTIVTNCSNNYGPFHFPEKLIPLIILNALEGKPLPVYGRGDNVRDWLFVDDHARALILAAEKGRPGETYAIGGHNERQNIDVVRGDLRARGRTRAERRHRAAREADLLRQGSARPRPPLCYRRVENRAGSRLAAGGDLRERPSQDGRMVSCEPGLVGARPFRRLSRPTSRDRGLNLRSHAGFSGST